MSEEGHLLKAAIELTHALNRAADENLPGKLAGIVKLHAKLAVGSAFIPIPGADLAASGVNIWTMYIRINKELELPFAENVVRSLASGMLTNLAGTAAGLLVFGSVLKFVPGLGTLGGAALIAGTTYALTIGAGFVYMKAVTKLLHRKDAASATEEDLRAAANEVAQDKGALKSVLETARADYKRNPANVTKPVGTFRQLRLEHGIRDANGENVRLYFSFQIRGCFAKTIRAIAWFYYATGQPLQDADGILRSSDGGVSIAGPATFIEWDPAECDGWNLTMPIAQLHLPLGHHALKCNVGIYCEETASFITNSQFAMFNVRIA